MAKLVSEVDSLFPILRFQPSPDSTGWLYSHRPRPHRSRGPARLDRLPHRVPAAHQPHDRQQSYLEPRPAFQPRDQPLPRMRVRLPLLLRAIHARVHGDAAGGVRAQDLLQAKRRLAARAGSEKTEARQPKSRLAQPPIPISHSNGNSKSRGRCSKYLHATADSASASSPSRR